MTNVNLFESEIINFTKSFRTTSFYKGEEILMIDVEYLSRKIGWQIIAILKEVGVNEFGFDHSIPLFSDDKIYLGTLLTNDKCYITLATEESASNHNINFKWIEG